MKKPFLLIFLFLATLSLYGQDMPVLFDTTAEIQHIKRLYQIEEQLVLNQDTLGMKKFYPDDFVVTNPFNQYIDKKKVIERVKGNIIKYSSYTRKFDAFRFYNNLVIVIGSEVVVPTLDANRDDAGNTVHRRFTEIWIKRGTEWKKIVRHATNIINAE